VWDYKTGALKQVLLEGKPIFSIDVNGNILVAGGERPVFVLDLNSNIQRTLIGHKGIVRTIKIHNNYLLTGSDDKTARVWDLESGKEVAVLLHDEQVLSLDAIKNTIVTSIGKPALANPSIKVWDLNSHSCIKTLLGHTAAIYSVKLSNNTIVSGSFDKTVRVWDLTTGACLKTINAHTEGVSVVDVSEDVIVSGSWDKEVKVWGLYTGQMYTKLPSFTAVVKSVQISGNSIMAASMSGSIKVFEIKAQ